MTAFFDNTAEPSREKDGFQQTCQLSFRLNAQLLYPIFSPKCTAGFTKIQTALFSEFWKDGFGNHANYLFT
jgi:hypothetical protein